METIRHKARRCATDLLPRASTHGTTELLHGCNELLVDLALALGCNHARTSGSPGYGILFETTRAPRFGWFTFFVASPSMPHGVAALAISDNAVRERTAELHTFVRDLCRHPGGGCGLRQKESLACNRFYIGRSRAAYYSGSLRFPVERNTGRLALARVDGRFAGVAQHSSTPGTTGVPRAPAGRVRRPLRHQWLRRRRGAGSGPHRPPCAKRYVCDLERVADAGGPAHAVRSAPDFGMSRHRHCADQPAATHSLRTIRTPSTAPAAAPG